VTVLDPEAIYRKVLSLEAGYRERDKRMTDVREVRGGRLQYAFPQFFSADMDRPVVANWIDVVSRDLSEQIAPLPALNTLAANMKSDKGRKFAANRGRIGMYYWLHSNLRLQMHSAADQYLSYGFAPLMVVPDFEARCPRLKFIDPYGCYPEFDINGACVSLTRKHMVLASKLAAMYPMSAGQILRPSGIGSSADPELTVYSYIDAEQQLIFVKERNNLVLHADINLFGICPVVVAVRPSHDGEMRGQFDDVIGPLAARAFMMRLTLEAAEQQVQAPVAVPSDVGDLPVGPNAIIRSDFPEKIGRVGLKIDQATFAEIAGLEQELRIGSRYPEARSGQAPGQVDSGSALQQLQGTFDTQIKAAQLVFGECLRRATMMAFEMDEVLWPDATKTIMGTVEGAPFSLDYTPSKDINGDYTCDVSYGMMSGMDPSRGLVFILQSLGAGLVDKATAMRQMPWDIDVTQLQQNIEIEKLREAGIAGVSALVQAIGPLTAQGGDPTPILQALATTIQDIQKGMPIEDALMRFSPQKMQQNQPQPPQAPPGPEGEAGPGGGPPPGGGFPPPGLEPSGLLRGVAPGQAGMPPGGRPSLQQLLASVGVGGKPNLSAGVRRSLPAA
jgi:hypothetical protein